MQLNKQTTLLAAVCLLASLLSLSLAVPLDVSDEAEEIKRSLMLSRFLGSADRLRMPKPSLMLAAERSLRPFAPLSSSASLSQQKRQRPSVQSRSGGMSLCLWKVCPAAPWLVSKRDSSDY